MPIIMFGDAWDPQSIIESCDEARLAGYLPKPISIARLVSSNHGHIHRPQGEPGAIPFMPQPMPIEVARLTSFTDGDPQLERELTSLYLATASLYLDEMRTGLGGGGGWSRAAHALKGASANIGAAIVARLAEEAERAAPSTDRLARIDQALDAVRGFVRQRSEQLASSARLRQARTG